MERQEDIVLKSRYIVDWLKRKGDEASILGAVVGVSGGVDSALALALCKKAWPKTTLGLILPCYSEKEDVEDALLVVKHFSCDYKLIDLSTTYDAFLRAVSNDGEENRLALSNLKPRLRMLTLYYFANLRNYLVCGTGNKDELYVGYFTKFGDGGVDILPLGDLTKGEVRSMAHYLGVPDKIVWRTPSAGLWKGQTDEGEMGISYGDLDAYLKGEKVERNVAEKIERLHRSSEHKRRLPSLAVMDDRLFPREGL